MVVVEEDAKKTLNKMGEMATHTCMSVETWIDKHKHNNKHTHTHTPTEKGTKREEGTHVYIHST
jgi:hypothetical protein